MIEKEFCSFPPGVIPEHHFYGSVLRHNEADGKPSATQCPLLSHRARDALTLRFLVFVNRATAGQATGGNDNDTSALKSEIKICHATECEAAKGFFEAFPPLRDIF